MNKKIFIFLSTIVFIVIIVIVGGYYFYKNPIDNNQENNNTNGLINEECEGNECTESKNFIDVVFKKTENDLLYFKPKNSSEIKSIKMSENVVFVEVILSENYDIIEEKNITLADFNEGDSVSAFINDLNRDKVSKLSRIIVSDLESN